MMKVARMSRRELEAALLTGLGYLNENMNKVRRGMAGVFKKCSFNRGVERGARDRGRMGSTTQTWCLFQKGGAAKTEDGSKAYQRFGFLSFPGEKKKRSYK